MIEAANQYCDKIGASPEDHQIVVFQHHDRPHRHIHVYVNRVPVGGGKALETSHNYARNVRVCQVITQELGFSQVEKLQEGKLRKVAEIQKEAQKFVNLAIKEALKRKCKSSKELERQLKEMGIECKFMLDEGRIKYSSYKYQGVSIKGQDVGFSAKQVQLKMIEHVIDTVQYLGYVGPLIVVC